MPGDDATRRDPVGQSRHDDGYVLVLADGSASSLILPESGEAVIGRAGPATLQIENESVSRRHALIRAGVPPTIEDLGSTNGTKVMGRRLAADERVPLPFGTVVEIGSVVAFVRPLEVRRASTQAATPGTSNAFATIGRMTVGPPAPAGASGRGPSRPRVLRDATMHRLYELVDVIAPSKLSVLILGETGVGKDVYAETVHGRSPRAGGPLVRINCAALPENLLEAELFGYERGAFTGALQAKPGLFEAADGGTVFLDEVGEMSLVTQAKLLRVLESGETMRIGSVKPKRVDVRFLSATNRDLEALAAVGQFRSDVFFRLNGVSIALPSLRQRPDDILPLAEHFLAQTENRSSFSARTVAGLRAHRWPGNIRELKNVVERAALLARGGVIEPEHLLFSGSALTAAGGEAGAPPGNATYDPPPTDSFVPRAPATTIRDEFVELERTRIHEAMLQCGGNQSRAARMLGISRTTLIKRLESYSYVRPRKGQ